MALPIAKTGSVMVCDKGTATVPLVASGSASVKICDVFLAAVSDIIPGANISPFGTCIITQTLCSPTPVGFWTNPFDNACIVGGVQSLLEGARLPCAIGGTIKLMSAAQASVLVGKNLAYMEEVLLGLELAGLLTRAQILAWALAGLKRQDPRFAGNTCNQFVAAAYAAAGIIFPEKRKGWLGLDLTAQDSEPVVKELLDSGRFNDILTPPGPVEQAEVGDIILWRSLSGDDFDHSAILANKPGADPDEWDIIYAGGAHHIVTKGKLGNITSSGKVFPPRARGPRQP